VNLQSGPDQEGVRGLSRTGAAKYRGGQRSPVISLNTKELLFYYENKHDGVGTKKYVFWKKKMKPYVYLLHTLVE
jgi:hypothetical protein